MFVVRADGETFEAMFSRFKRGVDLAGILADHRRGLAFVPNHERRRQKIRRARQRAARARGSD